MKKYFCRLSFFCLLLAMPVAASKSFIYVLHLRISSGSSIDVIDPKTNKIVRTIDGIPRSHGAVFSPDGKRAYITSETTEHQLYIVDTSTGKTLNKVVLSGRPNLDAITKDGKRVLVAIRDPGQARPMSEADKASVPGKDEWDREDPPVVSETGAVDIVDLATLKVKTIPMEGSIHDVYTTPDGKYGVAGSNDGEFLSVIDLQTDEIAWSIPYDRGVQTMAFETNPDGSTRRIFVDLRSWRGFSVVDFALHKEVARPEFPDFPEIHNRFMNVTNYELEPHTHGIGVSPDNKTLWLGSNDANAVIVYSLPDLKLLGLTQMPSPQAAGGPVLTGRAVGGRPNWITFTPDGSAVYVVCDDAMSVVAIDSETRKVLATIPIRKGGMHIHTLVEP